MSRAMVLAVVAALAGPGCKKGDAPPAGPPGGPPPVPVTLAPALVKEIAFEIKAVGTIQPIGTVAVKSLLGGTLMSVSFEEGQPVEVGAPLAEIDHRPLDANLRQATANLARDQAAVAQAEATRAQRDALVKEAEATLGRDTATHAQARREESRYKTLSEKELVAREDFDKLRTVSTVAESGVKANRAGLDSARAGVRAAQAAIESAKAAVLADQAQIDLITLQIGYASIAAPMSGRTGRRLVTPGNLIKASDEALVVITQMRPIHVAFSVSEQRLPEVLALMVKKPTVEARRPGETKPLATGTLTFVDSTVDTTTGTIALKATFDNVDEALWPGLYVDAVLKLETRKVLTVPSEAVQIGQNGHFVFVTAEADTVDVRLVTIGQRIEGSTLITTGLKEGEQVVVDGQTKLRKGAKIRVAKADPKGKE